MQQSAFFSSFQALLDVCRPMWGHPDGSLSKWHHKMTSFSKFKKKIKKIISSERASLSYVTHQFWANSNQWFRCEWRFFFIIYHFKKHNFLIFYNSCKSHWFFCISFFYTRQIYCQPFSPLKSKFSFQEVKGQGQSQPYRKKHTFGHNWGSK